MHCPNINLQEYKDLESAIGSARAHYLWDKNNGHSLDLTPNGEPSLLYKELLDRTKGDVVKALQLKSEYYSDYYLNKNNWFKNIELLNIINSNLSQSIKNKAKLDYGKIDKNEYHPNGEPKLDATINKDKDLKYNLEQAKIKILEILDKQLRIFSNQNKSTEFSKNLEKVIESLKTSGLEEINLIKLISDSKTYTQQANKRISNARTKLKNDIKYLSNNEKKALISELVEAKEFISAYTILDDIQTIYLRAGKEIPSELDIKEAIDNRKQAIDSYSDIMHDILADWLYPSLRTTNERLQNTGKAEISYDQFKNILKQGSNDIGMMESWLGALSSSSEVGSAAISLTFKRLLENIRLEDKNNLYELTELYDSLKGNKNDVHEFNKKFIRLAQIPSKIPVKDMKGNIMQDEHGHTITEEIIISKKALITPYFDDKFKAAKEELAKSLEKATPKEQMLAWKQWFKDNTVLVDTEALIKAKEKELSPKDFKDWYLKNTKDVAIKEEEGIKNYDVAYNLVPGSIDTNEGMFKIFIGDFIKPSDKYKNVEFDKLYNTNPYFAKLYDLYKEYNDKLHPNQKLKYGILPQVRKSGWDRVQSAGTNLEAQLENMKSYMTETFKFTGYDKAGGLISLSGQDVKQIPSYYLENIEEHDVSEDLLSSILLFSSMSNNYSQLSEVEPHVNILKDMLLGNHTLGLVAREITATKTDGNPVIDLVTKLPIVKAAGVNINQRTMEFINTVFYGEEEELANVQLAGKTVNLNKLGGFLAGITSANKMILNLNSGINNTLMGNLATFTEGVGGRYYTKQNWAKGQAYYTKNILEMTGDFGKAKPNSFLNLLMDEYDYIQGEFKDEYGRSISSTGLKRIFKSNALFFVNNAAEHQIQSVGALSMLDAKKFTGDRFETIEEYVIRKLGTFNEKEPGELAKKDKSYLDRYNQKLKEYNLKKIELSKEFSKYDKSLLEAYDRKDGRLVIKDQFKPYWTEKDRFDLMNKMHGVNKSIHGNYAKFDKSMLQRRWWGKLMIMFRKYIYTGFKRRYNNEYTDLELADTVQGYYNAFFGKLTKDIKNYGLTSALTMTYTTEQLESRNKVLMDLAVVVATSLILGLVSCTGDDDDDFLKAHLLLQAERLQNDITMYINPSDLMRVIRNPAISLNTLEKFSALINQTIPLYTGGITEKYKRDTGLYEKGDYKIKKKILDLVPIANQINNFLSPEDQLAIFKKPY